MQPDISWFKRARYGLFIHYGLYSLLGRGEWVLNRTDLATGTAYPFRQDGRRVVVENVPEKMNTTLPVVFRFRTKEAPMLYGCGGCRVPKVEHCRYDPVTSDIATTP